MSDLELKKFKVQHPGECDFLIFRIETRDSAWKNIAGEILRGKTWWERFGILREKTWREHLLCQWRTRKAGVRVDVHCELPLWLRRPWCRRQMPSSVGVPSSVGSRYAIQRWHANARRLQREGMMLYLALCPLIHHPLSPLIIILHLLSLPYLYVLSLPHLYVLSLP